jgi:hypothetical protein
METIIVAGGAAAAIGTSIAVVYLVKHFILSKAAGAGAGGAGGSGGGGNRIPTPTGGGSAGVPTGTNIAVQPHPNVNLTFSEVLKSGAATANPILTYPLPPNGIPFLGAVFDIRVAAVFTGLVLVGLAFDGSKLKEEEKKKLRVYRIDPEKGGAWQDITSHIDLTNNIAYGSTDHFSIFGVR